MNIGGELLFNELSLYAMLCAYFTIKKKKTIAIITFTIGNIGWLGILPKAPQLTHTPSAI